MFTRKTGPVWEIANEGTNGNDGTNDGKPEQGTLKPGDDGYVAPEGSDADKTGNAFAALDEDTRTWLQTKGVDSIDKLAKSARESEKMLGDRIKVPGKDATPEELDAFYKKLGRPDKSDDYQFTVPKDLPKELPYDGERAAKLKVAAHKLGLNSEQAQAIHDLYIADQVEGLTGASQRTQALNTERATKATEEIKKLWGPLDGDKAQANFELADRVFTEVEGGQELLAELKTLGIVGPNKEILSPAIANVLAGIGGALFKEGDVLRGQNDIVDNPFADGKGENHTLQMKLVKTDPDRARSLIAAAGKNVKDFFPNG